MATPQYNAGVGIWGGRADPAVRHGEAKVVPQRFAGRVRAPEFPVDVEWVGAAESPPRLAGLGGQVVLLEFWTFC